MKFMVPFILVICLFSQASACSLLFVGGDFTDDGANLFVRVEDGDLNDEHIIATDGIIELAQKAGTFAGFHGSWGRSHRAGQGTLCRAAAGF